MIEDTLKIQLDLEKRKEKNRMRMELERELERLLVDLSCEDCGSSDYDEYYMVQNDIWKAHGASNRNVMLFIGCLEERMGRLCRQGFVDFSFSISAVVRRRSMAVI